MTGALTRSEVELLPQASQDPLLHPLLHNLDDFCRFRQVRVVSPSRHRRYCQPLRLAVTTQEHVHGDYPGAERSLLCEIDPFRGPPYDGEDSCDPVCQKDKGAPSPREGLKSEKEGLLEQTITSNEHQVRAADRLENLQHKSLRAAQPRHHDLRVCGPHVALPILQGPGSSRHQHHGIFGFHHPDHVLLRPALCACLQALVGSPLSGSYLGGAHGFESIKLLPASFLTVPPERLKANHLNNSLRSSSSDGLGDAATERMAHEREVRPSEELSHLQDIRYMVDVMVEAAMVR
mmetsp:Transcript_582/g.1462  ORF Transcript_582/g.1462 Transcript_582/m.1462 type:complete len:291 (-) Transcript_582:437-1309(-)